MNPHLHESKQIKSLAIMVRDFDMAGADAISSLHHAEALAGDYEVLIITDTSPAEIRRLGYNLLYRGWAHFHCIGLDDIHMYPMSSSLYSVLRFSCYLA